MRKPKLYIETSVWNFYFANDAPEKKETTLKFYERVEKGDYEIYLSDVVLIVAKYSPTRLKLNEEIIKLAKVYILEKVLPENKFEDALHAATATVFELDALISWNLKHLANYKKMELINGINMREGYVKRLELITPMEVSDEEI
jgi:predicted nucleic acid-binding protein